MTHRARPRPVDMNPLHRSRVQRIALTTISPQQSLALQIGSRLGSFAFTAKVSEGVMGGPI